MPSADELMSSLSLSCPLQQPTGAEERKPLIPEVVDPYSPNPVNQQTALIRWTDDGVPVPIEGLKMGPNAVKEYLSAAGGLLYEGEPLPEGGRYLDPKYVGMTNLQVALVRLTESAANGNLDSLDKVLDRLIGKPKQQTESVTVSVSLNDHLERIANEL